VRSDHRDDDEDEDLFEEPTLEEVPVLTTSGIKPEVAAALAALKPARPTTAVPPSPSPKPSPKPSSSSLSSTSTSKPSSWAPPAVAMRPIVWGLVVAVAGVITIAMLRTRPDVVVDASAVPDVPVIVLGADALACTRLSSHGRTLECAFAPRQLTALAEDERYSRLEATRVQAARGGFSSVVLVDDDRVWRVLHADVAIVQPPRRAPRR